MPQGGQAADGRVAAGAARHDRYETSLAPDAPIGGGYQYWLGLYVAATGERLQAGTDDKYVVHPEP